MKVTWSPLAVQHDRSSATNISGETFFSLDFPRMLCSWNVSIRYYFQWLTKFWGSTVQMQRWLYCYSANYVQCSSVLLQFTNPIPKIYSEKWNATIFMKGSRSAAITVLMNRNLWTLPNIACTARKINTKHSCGYCNHYNIVSSQLQICKSQNSLWQKLFHMGMHKEINFSLIKDSVWKTMATVMLNGFCKVNDDAITVHSNKM